MGRAAVDVAPDKICVPLFEIVRRTARPREDAVAKARRESFDLLLDLFAHINAGAERHVTISPEGMLTSRRARCVEEALLRYENEGPLGMSALRDYPLPGGNFVKRSAEVHRPGAPACISGPGNRSGERVINLENARRVTEPRQAPTIARLHSVAGHTQELPWRHIKQNDARFRQFIEIIGATDDFDSAPEFAKISGQRVRNRLRSTPRQRPAYGVPGHGEHQTDRG